jgi:hypothetical protein
VLINSVWNKEELPDQWKESMGYHCCQLHNQVFFSKFQVYVQMKFLGFISVGFHVTDQLLIRFTAFIRYWRKNWSTMKLHQLVIDYKKAYDSVKKEVLYIIFMEFGVSMKLVRLIKMCLNETYSKVRIGKHLS